MRAPWEAVVFDLDGALVDSRPAIAACINDALRAHGLEEVGAAAIDPCVGPPLGDGFKIILRDQGADLRLVASCLAWFRARYRDECVRGTTVQPGLRPLVHRLATELPLAVATSKPLEFALAILERLDLDGYFAAVAGPSLDAKGERKAATVRRALAQLGDALGRPPEAGACAIVGDRSHDVGAGKELGLTTVGVTWGFGSEQELRVAGVDHLVHTSAELEALLAVGRPAATG